MLPVSIYPKSLKSLHMSVFFLLLNILKVCSLYRTWFYFFYQPQFCVSSSRVNIYFSRPQSIGLFSFNFFQHLPPLLSVGCLSYFSNYSILDFFKYSGHILFLHVEQSYVLWQWMKLHLTFSNWASKKLCEVFLWIYRHSEYIELRKPNQ